MCVFSFVYKITAAYACGCVRVSPYVTIILRRVFVHVKEYLRRRGVATEVSKGVSSTGTGGLV